MVILKDTIEKLTNHKGFINCKIIVYVKYYTGYYAIRFYTNPQERQIVEVIGDVLDSSRENKIYKRKVYLKT